MPPWPPCPDRRSRRSVCDVARGTINDGVRYANWTKIFIPIIIIIIIITVIIIAILTTFAYMITIIVIVHLVVVFLFSRQGAISGSESGSRAMSYSFSRASQSQRYSSSRAAAATLCHRASCLIAAPRTCEDLICTTNSSPAHDTHFTILSGQILKRCCEWQWRWNFVVKLWAFPCAHIFPSWHFAFHA